ncbi:hypothetical protein ACQR1N_00930 [Bradyrhizobium sp. HKCCYLRH1073]|uniref:hypothetical protein n=1 Tax=unclassified Bradyrhizobium TaxID=2631580 RepID=UPI003EB83FE4
MAEKVDTDWSAVIARCLAFLCLDKAKDEDPDKFNTVKKKVDFLMGMGLPQKDAAYVAGSTPASVAELNRLHNNKGAKRATKKRR